MNSLIIGETITTNAKLIANHFNTVAAKLNKKIVKAKMPFPHYLGKTTDETIFLSPNNSSRIRISNYALNLIKLLAPIAYQQKY